MKTILICAALTACLTGCAGLSADVHSATPAAAFDGEKTYAIARTPLQENDANAGASANARRDASLDAGSSVPPFEAVLRAELAKNGFTQSAGKASRYLISVAYETRPADVNVTTAQCGAGGANTAGAGCEKPVAASFALFGGRAYRHALTLRFFDRTTGREVYKVSATHADHDADPQHAMPALVKSALARLPFGAPADWRVNLQNDDASGTEAGNGSPRVVSVKPLQP